jgi:ubiquitin-protein ligase
VKSDDPLRVMSEAGSSGFSDLPPSPFGNQDELEFLCYLAYLRRGGHKSREVFNALCAFIDYPPFVLSFARLVSRRRLTYIDFLVVRETLRAFLVFTFDQIFKLETVGRGIGFYMSHWARLDIPARVLIDIDAWQAPVEILVPDPAHLRGRCGGPLDAVYEALLRGRRTMSVVRVAGSTPLLTLGRLPSGEHLVWDPKTLAISRHTFRALHSRDALQQALRQELEFINQVTLLVVDRSSSMGLIVPGLNRRAIAVATDFFNAFAAAVTAYTPPSLFGVKIGNDDVQWGVTIGQVDLGPAQGKGDFWASLEAAETAVVNLRLEGRKRILAITDGRDGFEGDFAKVAETYRRDGIILDAIVLAAPRGPLLALCASTSGRAFQPETVEDGCRVLRREEFIDLSLRRLPEVRIRSLTALLDLAQYNSPIPRADEAPVTVVGSLDPPPPTFRDIRVAQELAECRACGLVALPAETRANGWRVVLEAPLFRGSSRRAFWILAVTFGRDYPYTCPVFRFLAVPAIANVSDTGRVFCTALRDYHPRVAIASLISAIRELFDADDEEQLPLVAQERRKWTSEGEWLAAVADWNTDSHCPWPSFERAIVSLFDGSKEMEFKTEPGKAPESWRIQYSQVSWRKIEKRNEGSELLICGDEDI